MARGAPESATIPQEPEVNGMYGLAYGCASVSIMNFPGVEKKNL